MKLISRYGIRLQHGDWASRRAILATTASDFEPEAVILCVPNTGSQGDDLAA